MFPDVVILAGGLGKRLHSVTNGAQKVLAKIGEKPFLEILMDYIASQGGRRFILCVGHGSDEVEKSFKNKGRSREIIFSREKSPLGTGGAIKQGSRHVKTDQFLAMNGDCFCEIDYKKMIAQHKENKAKATIAVAKVSDTRDYGTVVFRGQSLEIEAFKEKQSGLQEAYVNTGTYCLNRDIFSLRDTADKFSIEHDFFPYLIRQGFYVFIAENKFIDIGTPERYQWAQEHLKN